MSIKTSNNFEIDNELLRNYFRNLVNLFFKILPIRENEEDTLVTYMKSLQAELMGCKTLVTAINNDSNFLTLISILQYLIDNPQSSVMDVKREVFKAISICNKLQSKYIVVRNEDD